MKPYEKDIEAEIARTMQLLDEVQPLEVHHLFRVRVMERVERTFGHKSGRMANLPGRVFDFRIAFMALLVMVNIGSTVLSFQNSKTNAKTGIIEFSESSGDDYSAQEFAYYDQSAVDTAATSEHVLTP